MILTGCKIIEAIHSGNIVISGFTPDRVNPNSYNYRLGDELKVYIGKDLEGVPIFNSVQIGPEGYVLRPGIAYLGVTDEIIGSNLYAMSLIGRSSIGRLGLFLQISANLGHTTSCHRWTLELYAARSIRVYPKMLIGQVSFWTNQGTVRCMGKTYALHNKPMESFLR